jgi:peptide/nickel transport system permease protein
MTAHITAENPVVNSSLDGTARPGKLWSRTIRQPRGYLSVAWLMLVLVVGVIIPLTSLVDPLIQNANEILQLPSAGHLLGTDTLGRDIFARLMFGGRDALLLSGEVIAVSLLIGTPLGLVAGFGSKWGDRLTSRFADLVLAIPGIIVLLAVETVAGNNLPLTMAVLGLLVSAGIIRLVRSSTQAVVNELYVDAARVVGLSPIRIALRHVLPNVAGPLIVQSSIIGGVSLLTVTGLQFLGLGPNPPAPSWGASVFEASSNISRAPWLMAPSGIVIILSVLAFNQLGDAFRDSIAGPGRNDLLTPAKRLTTQAAGPAQPAFDGETATGSDIALDVRNLTVTTDSGNGSVTLVDNVSFALRRGQTLGIVGESGCGKSMTALAILGLLPRNVRMTQGSVRVGSQAIAGLTERQLLKVRGTKISFIPQEPMVALDPNFSIGHQLVAPLRRMRHMKGAEAHTEALRLLGVVGITSPTEVFQSYPHQISGGMAQRVCIALALLGGPDVLIADEPTTALDVTVQAEILDLLRKLQADFGMAIVLVTHNFGVVADLCDNAVVMYAGQVVEAGPAASLLRTPTHPYSLGLLRSMPGVADRSERLPTISGTVPKPELWPNSCRFASRCPFVTDACTAAPVPMVSSGFETISRCIRVDELEELKR